MLPICSPDGRCVRVEIDGEERWGGIDGDEIVLSDGVRIPEADGVVPRARRARRKILAVHLTYGSRVREYDARTPPEPSYFMKPPTTLNGHRRPVLMAKGARFLNYEGELAVIVGRADEGRADRRGARLRRRLHLRQRHRHARLPPRRPRRDAAGEGPRRLPAARAGARAGGGVRPHRLHAAHVPQRRGRAGGDGGRPAVHGRVPARRPLPADHARARRRDPHGHAGELAADEAGRRRRGGDLRASAGSTNTIEEWDVDLAGPGEQMQVSAQTLHVALAIPEDEAERMVAEGREP